MRFTAGCQVEIMACNCSDRRLATTSPIFAMAPVRPRSFTGLGQEEFPDTPERARSGRKKVCSPALVPDEAVVRCACACASPTHSGQPTPATSERHNRGCPAVESSAQPLQIHSDATRLRNQVAKTWEAAHRRGAPPQVDSGMGPEETRRGARMADLRGSRRSMRSRGVRNYMRRVHRPCCLQRAASLRDFQKRQDNLHAPTLAWISQRKLACTMTAGRRSTRCVS